MAVCNTLGVPLTEGITKHEVLFRSARTSNSTFNFPSIRTKNLNQSLSSSSISILSLSPQGVGTMYQAFHETLEIIMIIDDIVLFFLKLNYSLSYLIKFFCITCICNFSQILLIKTSYKLMHIIE